MKTKTKRRVKHLLTRKKLVSKKTSRHILRAASIVIATVSTGSLAYAISVAKPVVTIAVRTGPNAGRVIAAPVPATPTPAPAGSPRSGRASWYALGLPAPDTLTCASRTFSRGSFLEVTNLRNGRVVVCRVNDYGPEAWTNRIIDLSRGSFQEVDSLGTGTIPVEIRQVAGPTGFNLPVNAPFAQIVGYTLCLKQYDGHFCDAHRQ